MKNADMLPTIEDQALDGVTGGSVGSLTAQLIGNALQTSMGVAKEGWAGVGRAFSAIGDFLQGKGAK
jgi:hypothetical protein